MPDQIPFPSADAATETRIAAAFGALATGEVPASSPRPAQAPRPPVRDDRGRRRRFGLVTGGALVAAAAVVIALVVGGEVNDARRAPTAPPGTGGTVVTTAPSTPSTGADPTPTTSGTTGATGSTGSTGTPGAPTSASAAEVAQAFAGVTRVTRSAVVTVPGGYEGADLDAGTIRFWRSTDGTTWAVDGTSAYPADVRGDRQIQYTAVIRSAGVLTGMQHASFLLYGEAFTGDSTGFVIVYADGADGWGVVKAGSDGNLHPSGAPVNPANQTGLMYDGGLDGGLLLTVDCSLTVAAAECGSPANQVRKTWRWDGTQFVVES